MKFLHTLTTHPLMRLVEQKLGYYFGHKAPAIPEKLKKGIVRFGPWIILLSLILTIPIVLALLGINNPLVPPQYIQNSLNTNLLGKIMLAISLIALLLEALSLPGLFKKRKSGWYLLYYSTLLGVLQNLVSLNIIGLIIGSIISFYILFQIKEYYT